MAKGNVPQVFGPVMQAFSEWVVGFYDSYKENKIENHVAETITEAIRVCTPEGYIFIRLELQPFQVLLADRTTGKLSIIQVDHEYIILHTIEAIERKQ